MLYKYLDITGQFRSVEDEVEVDWHNMSTNDKKPHHVRKNRKNGYHYAHNPETTVIKPKVENIVKSHMPHAWKCSLYLAQRLYSALIYNVISSSLQFPALSIPIDFQ